MNANINRLIGMGLKQKRTELALTQAQVARRLGKLQSYVSKIELGERSLQAAEVFAYADALEIEWIDLMLEMQAAIDKYEEERKACQDGQNTASDA